MVPGHVGVRNTKWLTEIEAATEDAPGVWQRGIAYKVFGPNVTKVRCSAQSRGSLIAQRRLQPTESLAQALGRDATPIPLSTIRAHASPHLTVNPRLVNANRSLRRTSPPRLLCKRCPYSPSLSNLEQVQLSSPVHRLMYAALHTGAPVPWLRRTTREELTRVPPLCNRYGLSLIHI